MLVGDKQENQVQLAEVGGALSRLLALRLQQDDEDSKQIADGIVVAMVRSSHFMCGKAHSTMSAVSTVVVNTVNETLLLLHLWVTLLLLMLLLLLLLFMVVAAT